VDEIAPGEEGGATIRTRGGHVVPVSRRHVAAVRARLGVG
jgi:two-component system LytT family response regulator